MTTTGYSGTSMTAVVSYKWGLYISRGRWTTLRLQRVTGRLMTKISSGASVNYETGWRSYDGSYRSPVARTSSVARRGAATHFLVLRSANGYHRTGIRVERYCQESGPLC
eukprot:scaffold257167_cov16-Prasinocladus_malaysianus.AAC.1